MVSSIEEILHYWKLFH